MYAIRSYYGYRLEFADGSHLETDLVLFSAGIRPQDELARQFELEIEKAKKAGLKAQTKALETDLQVLKRMEEQSERFGKAVGLDSASTFECIRNNFV